MLCRFTDHWQDACVGEHEVDPAEFGDTIGHRCLQPSEVADIALFRHDATTRLLDQIHGFVEVLRRGHLIPDAVDLATQIERDDVGALFGESDGMRTTLTAGRPGDECDLARQLSCHDFFPGPAIMSAPRCGRAATPWRS